MDWFRGWCSRLIDGLVVVVLTILTGPFSSAVEPQNLILAQGGEVIFSKHSTRFDQDLAVGFANRARDRFPDVQLCQIESDP